MIDYIEGTLSYIESDYIVVDVQGIGYRIFCGNPYEFQRETKKSIRVFTHYHVREDATLLYGFTTIEKRGLFRQLLGVSGVGPKAALSILASGTPEQIILAVQQEDVGFLTKFPGVGKKTAQRMILDLKDKLKNFHYGDVAGGIGDSLVSQVSSGKDSAASSFKEAMEALSSLGYHQDEINQIMPRLKEEVEEEMTADQVVKKALKLLLKS